MINVFDHKRSEDGPTGSKVVYVAQMDSIIPEDSVLNYVTFESVYTLVDIPSYSVLLVPETSREKLEAVARYPDAFDIKMVLMTGVPGSPFDRWFEEVLWRSNRVAYADVVSAINEFREASEADAASKSAVYAQEKSGYMRKDGSVKGLDANMSYEDEDIADDDQT